MGISKPYKATEFDLSGLNGISDKTLEMHFGLYEGYVKNTNTLNEKLAELLAGGDIEKNSAVFSELKRRLGFEYNGMVLHEYYFGNLKAGGNESPQSNSSFLKSAKDSFGSFETWKADFVGIGKMRGVGWAVCDLDPTTKTLSNHWITLHEIGNV